MLSASDRAPQALSRSQLSAAGPAVELEQAFIVNNPGSKCRNDIGMQCEISIGWLISIFLAVSLLLNGGFFRFKRSL